MQGTNLKTTISKSFSFLSLSFRGFHLILPLDVGDPLGSSLNSGASHFPPSLDHMYRFGSSPEHVRYNPTWTLHRNLKRTHTKLKLSFPVALYLISIPVSQWWNQQPSDKLETEDSPRSPPSPLPTARTRRPHLLIPACLVSNSIPPPYLMPAPSLSLSGLSHVLSASSLSTSNSSPTEQPEVIYQKQAFSIRLKPQPLNTALRIRATAGLQENCEWNVYKQMQPSGTQASQPAQAGFQPSAVPATYKS